MPELTRRELICRGLQLLSIGAALRAGMPPVYGAETCESPNASPDSQTLRTSLHYTDLARDGTKSCKGCAFFTAKKDPAACGYCMILDGSVSQGGHCDSWNIKEE